jgi:hypothetical protein
MHTTGEYTGEGILVQFRRLITSRSVVVKRSPKYQVVEDPSQLGDNGFGGVFAGLE